MLHPSRIASLLSLLTVASVTLGTPLKDVPHLRHPVALELIDRGRRLLTANERSGSITILATTPLEVLTEIQIGNRLSDLAKLSDGQRLLVTDEAAHKLLLVKYSDSGLRVTSQISVSSYPVDVQVAGDDRQCYVASLWSRRLSIVRVARQSGAGGLEVQKTIDLPFAPRKQLLLAEHKKLIIADSFGGRIAVVDTLTGNLERVEEIPAHNIRGMALGPNKKELWITHQILNPLAHTSFSDIHWGMLMGNHLRRIEIEALLSRNQGVLENSRLEHLGDVGNGAGDPGVIVLTDDGRAIVALSGVGEIAISPDLNQESFSRVSVERMPSALALGERQEIVYVSNKLSDTLSVVDLDKSEVTASLSLGPRPKLRLADEGEELFYNAQLSHDGWLSCSSCHTDGHSNGALNDNLGDNSFGAPKRVLSLLGVHGTEPLAWNGATSRLEDQIRKSIRQTMQNPSPLENQIEALTVFLRTLSPAPGLSTARGEVDEASIQRGERVFQDRQCHRCHAPPTFTSQATYDVGLADEINNLSFNPPSLRGLSQRDSFFHDNRAPCLEAVFTKHTHHGRFDIAQEALEDLLRFLVAL